jgi:peptide subunit release factor 1 (eRF1)
MLGKREQQPVDLECPVCGTEFKTTEREAAKGKVRCPKGHEFVVMGMLGGPGDPGEGDG